MDQCMDGSPDLDLTTTVDGGCVDPSDDVNGKASRTVCRVCPADSRQQTADTRQSPERTLHDHDHDDTPRSGRSTTKGTR